MHAPKAPCAVPDALSLFASPSVHASAAVQRATGATFKVARSALILSTHAWRAASRGSAAPVVPAAPVPAAPPVPALPAAPAPPPGPALPGAPAPPPL